MLIQLTDQEVADLIEEIQMLKAEQWGVPALDVLLKRLKDGATAD